MRNRFLQCGIYQIMSKEYTEQKQKNYNESISGKQRQ